MKIISCIKIFLCFSLLFNDLFGYLDPVSGTMIVQAIVAGIAALSLAIKTNWLKIKTFIYKHIKK